MKTKHLPFGFERPEDSPGFLLWQTTMTWQRLIKKALEPYNISHAQFVIMATTLWFGSHGKQPNQTNIIRWTKLDKMTTSKALKELVRKKIINRTEDKNDSRAKQVLLTSTGITLIKELVPIIETIDKDFFKILNTKEQSELITYFKKCTL